MNGDTALNGIVVLDKPLHLSSAQAVARIKDILHVKKAGHAGTLDPLATGILICCLNKATKLARFLLADKKAYRAVMQLGIETDTQDAAGKIVATSSRFRFSEDTIRSAFKAFVGDIQQMPPAYSALKHQGVPLYRYARKAVQVQKPSRSVSVYKIFIEKIDLPFISFEVHCSAGTYIRTLCADIGNWLGCGGHLKALRRIESSGFTIEEAIALPEDKTAQAVEKVMKRIIPMADALRSMPAVLADRILLKKVRYGQKIVKTDITTTDIGPSTAFFKLVDPHHNLLAVMQAVSDEERLKYCGVFI